MASYHVIFFLVLVAIFVFVHIQCNRKDIQPAVYVENKVKVAVTQDGCRTLVPYDFVFTDPGYYWIGGFGYVYIVEVYVVEVEPPVPEPTETPTPTGTPTPTPTESPPPAPLPLPDIEIPFVPDFSWDWTYPRPQPPRPLPPRPLPPRPLPPRPRPRPQPRPVPMQPAGIERPSLRK